MKNIKLYSTLAGIIKMLTVLIISVIFFGGLTGFFGEETKVILSVMIVCAAFCMSAYKWRELYSLTTTLILEMKSEEEEWDSEYFNRVYKTILVRIKNWEKD